MDRTTTEKSAKILVTGATGQSGSLIIKELVRQDIPARALVRDRNKARSFQSAPNLDIVEGDMLHPETLGASLDGIQRVLLISSADERMVETQCAFIDACKRAGVPHVIKFSGEESQIGFDPIAFRYTREHRLIEGYLEHSGLQWTHLRPGQFMQVYLREAATIKTKGTLLLPLENIEMSPVDLQDVAKIAVALLQDGGHAGETLRITGPEALSMAAIAAIIAKVVGEPVSYVNIPFEQRRQALLAAGLPAYLVDAIEQQSAERRRNPRARIDLSTHRLFNVQPTNFEQFTLRHAAAFGKPSYTN